MAVKGIVSVSGFSRWRNFEKLLNFGKMIVKVLRCRWLISQIWHIPQLAKNPQMFRNVIKSVVKMIGYCQYFGNFKSVYIWLGCARLYTSRKSLIGGKMSK